MEGTLILIAFSIGSGWFLYQFLRRRYPLFCFFFYAGIVTLFILYTNGFPLVLWIPNQVIQGLGFLCISGPILVPLLRISLNFSLGMMDLSDVNLGGPPSRGYKQNSRTGYISPRRLSDQIRGKDEDEY